MIKSVEFIKALKKNEINFYTGVPDSLFSSLCNTFETKERKNHIISTNEGSSLGLAIGYHLGTGKIPLVYLQNSGLGNLVNPLVSLADKKVFKIPIFLSSDLHICKRNSTKSGLKFNKIVAKKDCFLLYFYGKI